MSEESYFVTNCCRFFWLQSILLPCSRIFRKPLICSCHYLRKNRTLSIHPFFCSRKNPTLPIYSHFLRNVQKPSIFPHCLTAIAPKQFFCLQFLQIVRKPSIHWHFYVNRSIILWVSPANVFCCEIYQLLDIIFSFRGAKHHHHNAINVYTHYKFQETTSDTNDQLWINHSSVIVCTHQIG